MGTCFNLNVFKLTVLQSPPSMWAFIRARLWVWNIYRLRRWCGQMCSCSWIRQKDFVPQAANLLPSPHPWSPGRLSCAMVPLLCTNKSQFSQKPTQRLILTGFMPTQSVLTGPDKAVAAFQALVILRWCLHLEHKDSWGGGLGTAPDSAATRTVCLPDSSDIFLSFFFRFLSFNSAGNSCVSSRHGDFYHELK